jgi:serine/threonine protein kinase
MNRITEFRANRFRGQLTFEGVGRLMTALLKEEDHETRAAGAPQIDGYVIDQLLGRGAGGSVYLAWWGEHDEPVALKVLSTPLGRQKSDSRAWRELDVLSQLKIHGVPRVLDYGVAEGRMYITTKFIEGKTLIQHCDQSNLSLNDRVGLLIAVADLVQRVHEHGVIHRDLKPTNIIIQPDGTPVLLDFGIAFLTQGYGSDSVTAAGDPIGTVAYMAPEQARGENDSLSSRCDIYAMGAIACELLTGRTPHDVHVAVHEAIRRVAQESPRPPIELNPQCPKSLSGIVGKALEAKSEDRYASAAALAEDLRRWRRHEPIPWQKTRWFARHWLALKRNPAAYLAKAAIWFLVFTTLFASSLAYAGFKTAEGERLNAAEASKLKDEAQALAEDQRKFADQQTKAAAHWEAQARERDAWLQQVRQSEIDRVNLRERQKARVQKAVDSGDLYGASIVLLNFAEEFKELRSDDRAMLDAFVEYFDQLIEQAAAKSTDQPNFQTPPSEQRP